ncbi:MAG: DUF2254 domain-containing protein [Deltaproteobacteria bacterium]|nr:DUF2254 domain-containing protein [Deltaproteobacteria bacterium]
MHRSPFDFSRGMVAVMGGLAAVAAAGLAADLLWQGRPLSDLARFDVNEARHLTNLLSRSSNQILAVVFTTVAIAVPLTANMYSVKFLELFVRDPVNRGMLTLVLVNSLGVIWAGTGQKQDFVAALALYGSLLLTIACFTLVIPYLYYVFRFLHPNSLLRRLEAEIAAGLGGTGLRPSRVAALRTQVAEGIEHVADVAIRSVERADRSTAIESVLSLERVARELWRVKAALPPAWFDADPGLFLGFSSKAVDELAASRSWVEMKILSQLRQVMSAAIPRMHDLVSTISRVTRRLGVEKPVRADAALREMVIGYFNTFLRLALNRRDVRALFIVFDQYRTFAEALCAEQPEELDDIADHFVYYGSVAREQQMSFVVELVAHDLGALVEQAWAAGAPNREVLLDHLLRYDAAAPAPLSGVKKAQALAASFFLLRGETDAAQRVARSFAGLPDDLVADIRDDLLGVTREKYWEVNERRMNIDYVPAARREKLREFFTSLAPTRGAAPRRSADTR